MDGVLVVDKPEGITSHDVVAAARRALREKRIGHTGTLDPLATGVLPLACGKATRLVRFLSASAKTYEATVRFGVTTDTYDVTGTETGRVPGRVSETEVTRVLSRFIGSYEQVPPPYSAKKVDGVRAYLLARRDEPVVLKPVAVHVDALEMLSFDGERAGIRVTCSAGYYVRSLAHDLGQAVGVGGCLETLRRVRSGDFAIEQAIPLDELCAAEPAEAIDWLLPLERLLPDLEAVTVTDEGRLRVTHGRELQPSHFTEAPVTTGGVGRRPPAGWTRILDTDGRLLALGQPGKSPDSLHPELVLV